MVLPVRRRLTDLAGPGIPGLVPALLIGLGLAAPAAAVTTVVVNEGTGMAVSRSPDGASLVMDLQGHLWRLPAAGGQARALTDGLGDDRLPRFSPDGRQLVFQSFRNGHWDVWVMPAAGGTPRPLTQDAFDDREPVWSPDGTQVIFSSDRAGSFDLWSLTLATGELQALTDAPGDEYWPAMSGDGRQLAYVADQGGRTGIYRSRPGGTAQLVAGTTTGRPQAPEFSPDGRALVFVMPGQQMGFPSIARQQLWQVELTDSPAAATPLTDPADDVVPVRPHWAADGTLIYSAGGGLRQQAAGGGAPRTVAFTAALTVNPARYRPRPWRPAPAPGPARGLLGPAVSPADGTVVLVALGDLWRIPRTGEAHRLTDDPAVERDPAFSPDGRQLVFVTDRGGSMQLWLRDLASGTDRQLTRMPRGLRHPVFAPDGSAIAFQQAGPRGNQDFTLHRLALASGQVSAVKGPGLWPGPMAWSADGKRLLVNRLVARSGRFREGRNQLTWIPLAGGGVQALDLAGGQVPDGGLALDRAGRRLALVLDGRLHLQALDDSGQAVGGPRALHGRDLADMPAWDESGPGGGELVFVSPRGLARLPAGGGRIRHSDLALVTPPREPAPPLRIRAGRLFDGSADTYRERVDILIRDGRIVAVEPWVESGGEPADGIPLLDARDATVMPGLFDHHAHQQPHEGGAPGRAWLAFGVTSIVEPGGEPYESRELAESWDQGRRPGPRLFFAGPQLDGALRFFPFAVHADNPRRLRAELDRGRRLGASLAKTYTRLPIPLQAAAIRQAHRLGIPVTSHEVYPALALGADRVEHLRGTSRLGHSAKQSDLLRVYGDVTALMGAAGASVSPTIAVAGGFFDFFLAHPEIRELPAYQAAYPAADRQALEAFARLVGRQRELLTAGLGNARQGVADLHGAGARILAGTDAPIFPAGLSLVAELANYRAAGLPAADVLRSATVNAADAVGAGAQLGRVAPGWLADLIVVDGDPLADPAALLRVRTTLKGGRIVAGDPAP